MATNPAIILGVKPPDIQSPMQTIGGLMQIRDQMSQIALRQQQVEQARQNTANLEAEQQQKNRDLADQNTLQEIERDPIAYKAIHSGDFSALAGKVQPKTLQSVQAAINTALTNETARSVNDLKLRADAHGVIGESLASLQQMRTPDGKLDLGRVNESLPSVIEHLAPELKALGVDPAQVPSNITDEDHLNGLANKIGAGSALTNAALKLKTEQTKNEQTAALARSEQSTADLNNFKLGLMKGATDPNIIGKQVDALIDPRKFPKANADAKAAAALAATSGDPERITAAVQGIYNEQVGKQQGERASIPVEVDKQKALIPGEVNKAVQVAQATIPARVAEQVAAAKALRMGDNSAVAGVAPSAIASTQEHAIKLDQGYATAKQVSDTMAHILDLTLKGNKAAGANVPLAGVETLNAINGIKRINSAEISQYGTAGSLLDGLKGKIGKLTEGQPIPADVLSDIRQLHTMLGQDAYAKYAGELDSLNKRTGASYKPTYEAPKEAGTIRARDPQGKLHEAPAGTPLPAGWRLEQ